MDERWPTTYPDPERLRREIRLMVEAVAGALREVFGDSQVRAIWFKGSAQKRWESPMDYVPSLSDVDIHVWLSDQAAPKFHQLESALQVQRYLEQRYADTTSDPIHVPRPQINLVNDLLQRQDYLPSPAAIVETIFGLPQKPGDYSDQDRVRQQDRAALIEDAAESESIPKRAIDRPGAYMWDLLRGLSWRVSPIGSRLLSLSGADPEQAWSMNRTQIAAALRERGFDQVTAHWEGFYESAWRYFLSSNLDGDAGRDALRAAHAVLGTAGTLAQDMAPRG